MAVAVIMPRQGQSVESCIITKWEKKTGDPVNIGDILFSYETDKAAFEEEAKVAGTMLATFFEEDDDVPCLVNVAVIGEPGEDVSEFRPDEAQEDSIADNAGAENKVNAVPEITSPAGGMALVAATGEAATAEAEAASAVVVNGYISPRAKNLAVKERVDTRLATPTGPKGRIIERDIQELIAAGMISTRAAYQTMMENDPAYGLTGTGISGRITTDDLAKAQTAAITAATTAAAASALASAVTPDMQPAYEEVKMSNIRKVIGKAMVASLSSMAQLTLNTSFDATEIMAFRAQVKSGAEQLGLQNITLNDIIMYTVSRVLLNHKALNANLVDDKMLYFRNVHLGMAVDTERGLMVPNIFNADTLSLNEIAVITKKLATECQKGTVNPDVLKGGTFTVTNLGSLGVESFTPVINPPQTGILGVCGIVQKPKEVNGQIKLYPAMGLSLTFDHRAIDGAPAAKFLQNLKVALENFSLLLAK